jgi:hypothetical protein
MSKNKSNKRSSNSNKSRKSLKGKWNHIGAPPKNTRWPGRPFTTKQLFERNSKGANAQCELSLRNKVDALVATGEIVELKSKKQPHGAVGRPMSVFVLASKFDASKMEKADKKAKTPKAAKKSTVVAVVAPTPATAPASVAPATTAPVASSAAPAPEPTAAPAPAVSAPVASEAAPAASESAPAPQVG